MVRNMYTRKIISLHEFESYEALINFLHEFAEENRLSGMTGVLAQSATFEEYQKYKVGDIYNEPYDTSWIKK